MEISCVAECGLVLWGIGGELFIVSRNRAGRPRPYFTRKWIHSTNISRTAVSSIIDSGRIVVSLFEEGDAAADGKSH